ncbi:hypothetical protein P280DRAFT_112099 [Massarina eburnea CBS 473.64]|uniref:Serine hydrolase domain-containing protein n=1 Tax=Massarina eburnea CBS 473.64 TaxID=1395130 RepID=A0A6A6RPF4_9PLEO|nr:hypothetical protein P280DRAFT_112099 [Massarina eburnea CBS 473.64]
MSSVKPTILAFHGSGSNATIHTIQMARLSRILRPHFDIISLEAPFPSPAGPGILPFFEGCGPYYRWLPPSEKLTIADMRSGAGSSSLPPSVATLVHSTVTTVTAKGGRVVGLLGFSQGTRVVAGLLKGAEIAREKGGEVEGLEWCDFAFGISVCGSYPPPLIPESAKSVLAENPDAEKEALGAKIKIPTLHVLGNQDEWEWASKLLIEGHYDVGGGSELVSLDIGHHYPVKPEDSQRIADWVLQLWKEKGAERAVDS